MREPFRGLLIGFRGGFFVLDFWYNGETLDVHADSRRMNQRHCRQLVFVPIFRAQLRNESQHEKQTACFEPAVANHFGSGTFFLSCFDSETGSSGEMTGGKPFNCRQIS